MFSYLQPADTSIRLGVYVSSNLLKALKTDTLDGQDLFVTQNPVSGDVDFQLLHINDRCGDDSHISKFYFVVYIRSGMGKMQYELRDYHFAGPCLIYFSPFHPFRVVADDALEGFILQFSSEFYWFQMGRHKDSNVCQLFHHVTLPVLPLSEQDVFIIDNLFDSIRREFEWFEHPDRTMISNYLNGVFVHSARIRSRKKEEANGKLGNGFPKEYAMLKELKCLIYQNFRKLKRPSDYADLLHITTSALTKTTKKYYNKTVTDLIQDCVLEEARKELAHSGKSIKEVAVALGFEDPYYFSRLFKKVSGISPDVYRQQVHRFLHG